MNCSVVNNILTTSTFEHDLKRLAKRYKSLFEDLAEFKKELIENPEIGADLGKGLRKVRLAIKSKHRGKSGGGRIITYTVLVTDDAVNILLVTMYDKSEESSKTLREIRQIISTYLD
ncbi:MAG: addiction module toxin RelE [Cyclobacteriaceae bacterium]|nr:addiction module toxin RelE [Cyclobacteriaceae bacterium]